MAVQQYSTGVQAPNFQRLPVVSAPAPAPYQSTKRTVSTKSVSGLWTRVKLTCGTSDVAEMKANIFRPKATLSVGTYNVRTIMDDYAVKLWVHEMIRFRCDIVGIAETHQQGVEEMQEGKYKILASGKEEGRHSSGVAMVLSGAAQRALIGYSPVSDRILLAKFRSFTGELIVIQVYAPTAEAEPKIIDSFYDDLQTTIVKISGKSCVVLMGDFNAEIGNSRGAANGAVGRFGYLPTAGWETVVESDFLTFVETTTSL